MEQTIAMKYLSHNLKTIEKSITQGDTFMLPAEMENYAKVIDLISEVLMINKRTMETIHDDSAEARDSRRNSYNVKRIHKLEMIELITKL